MNRQRHLGLFEKDAFTLIELLVVIGICCLLACFMLPALAHVHVNNSSAVCLSNLRQLQLGANMYRDDNNDNLIPNAPGGDIGWVQSAVGWHAVNANTNPAPYSASLMWPYINEDISVFRCPADYIPSDNGYRIRSYSMNGQMGIPKGDPAETYNSGFQIFRKGSDIACITPANAWVFCNESMYSMNDGYLQLDLNGLTYPDVPAAYHANGCGFSFADGHAEIHRWEGPWLFKAPYAYGVVGNGSHWPSSANDNDYKWIYYRSGCRIGQ